MKVVSPRKQSDEDDEMNEKRDERKVSSKFEAVEPHPAYCKGRFVIVNS